MYIHIHLHYRCTYIYTFITDVHTYTVITDVHTYTPSLQMYIHIHCHYRCTYIYTVITDVHTYTLSLQMYIHIHCHYRCTYIYTIITDVHIYTPSLQMYIHIHHHYRCTYICSTVTDIPYNRKIWRPNKLAIWPTKAVGREKNCRFCCTCARGSSVTTVGGVKIWCQAKQNRQFIKYKPPPKYSSYMVLCL